MAAESPLRIALIGAGRIAHAHARAIDATDAAILVAVVDPDPGASAAVAEGRGAWTVPDLETAIATGGFDAAIIAAPSALHEELTLRSLRAGIHTLVEKPLAPSTRTVRELVAAADASGCVLASAQVLRFLPTTSAARPVVEAGRLGAIEQVVERRVELRTAALDWWRDVPNFLLHHWGSHSIDLAIDLLGVRPREVYCLAGSGIPGFDGVDNLNLLASLDGGGRLALSLSFSSRAPRHDLLIIGRDGTLEFTGYSRVTLDGEVLYDAPEERVLALGFEAQLTDFIASVDTGMPGRAAARTIVACHATLDAADRSLETGRPEYVDLRTA